MIKLQKLMMKLLKKVIMKILKLMMKILTHPKREMLLCGSHN